MGKVLIVVGPKPRDWKVIVDGKITVLRQRDEKLTDALRKRGSKKLLTKGAIIEHFGGAIKKMLKHVGDVVELDDDTFFKGKG